MIETERLVFRKYDMNDLDFFMTMTSNPEVMKFIGSGQIWTEQESKQRLERFISRYDNEDGTGLMLAFRKEDQIPIGHAGLVLQNVEEKVETEVGYWISHKFWKQGYAVESAMGWRDYGFNMLGRRRLISIIQHANQSSIHVAIKNGMKYERDVIFNDKNVALFSIER
jgi:RimJ/RimL family protein N-acetyltransferase